MERVERALERYRPCSRASHALNGAQLLEACREVDGAAAALAAVDMALWDRAGRGARHARGRSC